MQQIRVQNSMRVSTFLSFQPQLPLPACDPDAEHYEDRNYFSGSISVEVFYWHNHLDRIFDIFTKHTYLHTYDIASLCCAQSLSRVQLFVTSWTPLSTGILHARILEQVPMPSSRQLAYLLLLYSRQTNLCFSNVKYEDSHDSKISKTKCNVSKTNVIFIKRRICKYIFV